MLEASRRALLERLPDDAVVLDVGGWADPFERADWVIDLLPYETRGLYARNGWAPPRDAPERFGPERWIQRDLCDRQPYPFAEGEIDFAICAQTLEDLRDPIWVCRELSRVARAGYIELPSRLEEQSYGVNGPFVGWSHHRWLIDLGEPEIQFTGKLHAIHSRPEWFFPAGFWERLTVRERAQTLWWEGEVRGREQVLLSDEEADRYLRPYVERELAARVAPGRRRGGFRRPRRRRGGPAA